MNFETEIKGQLTIVTLNEKRFDAKIAVVFKDAMKSLIDKGSLFIVVNLKAVEFIDSSGLGSIVTALKLIGRKGDVFVCGLNDSVRQMFSLTRMDRVFKIFPSIEGAVDNLKDIE